ncbi:hypothetical protein [Aeromonas sobria]|uniref:hypothetical protein n=1 Tax=Aeromonas sobria TaxID=646 RepID=UPI0012FF143F|nr:hypothetical protein [Aeromonas sobria]
MLQRQLTLLLFSLVLMSPAAQAESLLLCVPMSDTPENKKLCESYQQIDIHLSRG